jgi:tetraacyldisaccharide 4'-kinase
LLRSWLWTASLPYGWATRWRNDRYDRGERACCRVPVPVVSVGNLTLGGTGKTPCVEYVARLYRDCGRRVAILSRGYGGERGRNDEALLLEQNLPGVPHLQGGDRVALAAEAVERLHCDVLVLDDGFQHRRLARDLDLVLVDATDPWGQGYLFPRGLLREAPAGLRRAGAVILTRCDQLDSVERGRLREAIARLAPQAPVAEARHRPLHLVNGDHATAPLDWLRERPVAAFCGVGNPEAFRRTLAGLGADVRAFRVFPDHHAYTPSDREDLRAWAAQVPREGLLVTTQKDLVKLRRAELGGRGLWALRICLAFDSGQQALDRQLREALTPSQSAAAS